MYYDDDARRFNFLSGLVLGAGLGAGLTFLLGTRVGRGRVLLPRRSRPSLRRRSRRVGAGIRASLRSAPEALRVRP